MRYVEGTGRRRRRGILVRLLVVVSLAAQLSDHLTDAKCLTNKPEIRPKRHLYFNRASQPITIEASERPSHRLVSHVLEVLLREVFGYESVVVTRSEDSHSTTTTLNRLAGCPDDGCVGDEAGSHLPAHLINLEVWSQAGFSMERWLRHDHLVHAGPLGPVGRYGWFMSTPSVDKTWSDNAQITDHWRALTLTNVTAQYNLLPYKDFLQDFLTRANDVNKTSLCAQRPYNRPGRCHNGLLYNEHCLKDGRPHYTGQCAVLLSSYPDVDAGSLEQQIVGLGLNVVVAWIGNRLDGFVQERTLRKQPSLFFNWVPNTLTATGNYTRVHFPSCTDHVTDVNGPRTCDFRVHQLSKFMWGGLRKEAPLVTSLISQMHFSQNEYDDLLKLFMEMKPSHNDSEAAYASAACEWVRRNEAKWSPWIPDNLHNTTKIYLGGMFPITGETWQMPGVAAGVDVAVDRVNQMSSVLTDYELVVLKTDTRCKVDVAMAGFIDYIENETHPVAGIIGPACGETAEAVAGVSQYYNTLVMSYSAENLLITDHSLLPFFFRAHQPNSKQIEVYSKMFAHFGWHQVALMADDKADHQAFLRTMFQGADINVVIDSKLPSDCSIPDIQKELSDVKARLARIIILTSYESCAKAIMCQAFHMSMTPVQGYVWFLPSWFTEEWWMHDGTPCNDQQLLAIIDGHFQLNTVMIAPPTDRAVGNLTVEEWAHSYFQKLKEMGDIIIPVSYASIAYDSVWVYALSLHELLKEDPSALGSLRSDYTTRRLRHHMSQVRFDGVSGPFRFADNDRMGRININQFSSAGKNLSLIGRYAPDKNVSQQLDIYESAIVWEGNVVPQDGALPEKKQCGVERFRALLGLSCDMAIVVANVMGISLFGIFMIVCLIVVKKRFDDKVQATRQRMEELGLMADTSWLSLDQWEVSREHVVLNRKLGEGAFGTVYGGEAFFEGMWVAVAVKTLKIGSSPEEKLDFLSEAEMMKRFDHENIVKLMGVCTRREPAYNIMEFMLHGDLKTFLLSRRHMVGQEIKESEDITPSRLTQMAVDVANGLNYLFDLKYVHRDIACRNCLVHVSKTVKIGDFGMTRPMFDSDYYRFNKRGMLPVRWMAPESLIDGLFTPKSDMWSYGILLYEIMTFGSFPYQGLSNKQVLEHVKEGHTIQAPATCGPLLRDLVQACWAFDTECRPDITDVLTTFLDNPELIKPCLDTPRTAVAMDTTGELALDPPPAKQRPSLPNNQRSSGPVPNRFSVSNMSEQSRCGGPESPPSPHPTDPFSLLGNLTRGAAAKFPSFSSVIRSPMSRSLSVGEERALPPVQLAPTCNHTRLVSMEELDTSCAHLDDDDCSTADTTCHVENWSPEILGRLPGHISIPGSLEDKADSDYCSDNSNQMNHCHMTMSSLV